MGGSRNCNPTKNDRAFYRECSGGKRRKVTITSTKLTAGDPQEKAERQVKEGHLTMPVAYDLSLDYMRELGLYISHPRSPDETDRPFSEPGLIIVNDKGQAQVIDLSNAPFARPELEIILHGLEYIRDPAENYPIRGTFLS